MSNYQTGHDVVIPSRGAVDDRNTIDSQITSTLNSSPLTHMLVSKTREYLQGMEYPASKIGLYQFARRTGAPEILLQVIDKLPPKSYRSLANVVGEMRLSTKF